MRDGESKKTNEGGGDIQEKEERTRRLAQNKGLGQRLDSRTTAAAGISLDWTRRLISFLCRTSR